MRIASNWFWAPLKYARGNSCPASYLGFFYICWYRINRRYSYVELPPKRKHVVVIGHHNNAITWLKENGYDRHDRDFTIVTSIYEVYKTYGLMNYEVVEVYGCLDIDRGCRQEIRTRAKLS